MLSSAVAINIALFGLIGPFAASLMDRWGLRRVLLAAVALLAVVGGRHDADAQPVAADAALGRSGRRGHRRHLDGARRHRRLALVRRAPRAGARRAHRRPTPPVNSSSCRCSPTVIEQRGWRSATLIVSAAAVVVFGLVDALHARPASGCWTASLRTGRDGSALDGRRGPCAPRGAAGRDHSHRRSGCSPAPSSSAAPAPTV